MNINDYLSRLAGSYEAISKGGFALDALQTLTGGFCERYNFEQEKLTNDLFEKMESVNLICLIILGCEVKKKQGLTLRKLEQLNLDP